MGRTYIQYTMMAKKHDGQWERKVLMNLSKKVS